MHRIRVAAEADVTVAAQSCGHRMGAPVGVRAQPLVSWAMKSAGEDKVRPGRNDVSRYHINTTSSTLQGRARKWLIGSADRMGVELATHEQHVCVSRPSCPSGPAPSTLGDDDVSARGDRLNDRVCRELVSRRLAMLSRLCAWSIPGRQRWPACFGAQLRSVGRVRRG